MLDWIIWGSIWWVLCAFACALIIHFDWIVSGLNFLRPDIIYHNTKLNYFGVGVVCLALNLFYLPIALCYWFYKLCTVGRR